MPVNSSSSIPDRCSDSTVELLFFAFVLSKMLFFLPLSILLLCLALRRRRQRRQRSFETMSHSDVFTFHVTAIELMFVFGSAASICGIYTGVSEMLILGFYMMSLAFPGQMCFHILTCVERYLAVVHPVVYLGLRQSGGVKIRNISIVFVWLLCFGWSGVTVRYIHDPPVILLICSLVLSLIVVSFCSLSVLCVLIRPGPGKVERVDLSKQRAFYTMMAIMGVLWLWFAGLLVCMSLGYSDLLSQTDGCFVVASANWLSLPGSLVLPLLFLQRAGKLPCCHQSSE